MPDPPVQDPPAPSPFPSASYVNREQERLARRHARTDRLRAWEGWPEPCDLLDGDATVVWTLPNGVNPQPVPSKYANHTPEGYVIWAARRRRQIAPPCAQAAVIGL